MITKSKLQEILRGSVGDEEKISGDAVFDLLVNLAIEITGYDSYMSNEMETDGGVRDTLSDILDWMDFEGQIAQFIADGKLDHDAIWEELDGHESFEYPRILAKHGIKLESKWSEDNES